MFTRSGPRVLGFVAIAAIPALVLAVVVQARAERFDMLWPLVPFLLGFACFKGALAWETGVELRAGGAPAETLIARYGSRSSVSQWIGYKLAAAGMATAAGCLCLVVALS